MKLFLTKLVYNLLDHLVLTTNTKLKLVSPTPIPERIFSRKIRKVTRTTLQGDTSGCFKPPVDIRSKVQFWPGLAWLGQAKTELLI